MHHQDAGPALQLAADNELLQIAAGKRARFWIGQVLAHVVVLGDPGHHIPRRAAVDQAVAHDAFPHGMVRENDVLGERQVRDGGVADALFRHEGGIASAPPGDGLAAAGLAHQLHRIRRLARPLARYGVEKLRLTVARDSRHRDDLAGPHHKIDALQRNAEWVIGRHGETRRARAGVRRVPHRSPA